jgi:hypothetical protein
MKNLLVDIGNTKNLAAFLKAVENLDFVKSIKLTDGEISNTIVVKEAEETYNWTNPSRPATPGEIDSLIDEMEADVTELSTEEVRKKLAQWATDKQK